MSPLIVYEPCGFKPFTKDSGIQFTFVMRQSNISLILACFVSECFLKIYNVERKLGFIPSWHDSMVSYK